MVFDRSYRRVLFINHHLTLDIEEAMGSVGSGHSGSRPTGERSSLYQLTHTTLNIAQANV